MRLRELDLNLLVTLDALIAHKNITRASEQLNLSQSAVSGMLARLRLHYRDKILVRVGRRMELTPLALEIAPPLRAVLREVERIVATRQIFDPLSSERTFTIACSDYVWSTKILPLQSALQISAPDIRLMYLGPSNRFLSVNVDLVILPKQFMFDDCPAIELPPKRYVAVACRHSKTISDEMSLESLLNTMQIRAYGERPTFIESWFNQRFGKMPEVGAIAPNYSLVPEAIVGTEYIAIIPEDLANKTSNSMLIKHVNIPIELPLMTDVLQWHISRYYDHGLEWMRTKISDFYLMEKE